MSRYGDNNTIHRTRHVNVETDANGQVVSVWFRCRRLPFDQTVVNEDRASEMRHVYAAVPPDPLDAVIVDDGPRRPPRADEMIRPTRPDSQPFRWPRWLRPRWMRG